MTRPGRGAGRGCAAAAPTQVEAEYGVYSSGVLIGRVKETYTLKGGSYSIQSVTRAEGPLDSEATVRTIFPADTRAWSPARGSFPST